MPDTREQFNAEHLNRNNLKDAIPQLRFDGHKGDRGGVLVVGGSFNYRGAPLLAALGALRSGAGIVVLAVPDFMVDAASAFLPEAIFVPLKTRLGAISLSGLPDVLAPWINGICSCTVFGPGIGRNEHLEDVTSWFLNKYSGMLLLDADALYHLPKIDYDAHRPGLIITPHAGEAARILSCSPSDISGNRSESALKLAERAKVALLKGMGTIVTDGSKSYIIDEGSPALAVPGSGDVLSGVIATLAVRMDTPFKAATVGALLHAVAGSDLESLHGKDGNLAREIANEIPNVIRRFI